MTRAGRIMRILLSVAAARTGSRTMGNFFYAATPPAAAVGRAGSGA
jgi:hypothetical protein